MNEATREDQDESGMEPMVQEKGTLVFGALAGIAAAYLYSVCFRFLRQSNEGNLFIGFLVAGALAGAFASIFVNEQRRDQPVTFNGWCLVLITLSLILALLLPDVG